MALPYDTTALIKQTQAMLAQTKAEGTKAFAGSSYDTQSSVPQNAPTGSTAPSSAISSTGLDPATIGKMMQDAVGSISSSNDTIDASINAAIQSQRDAATANAAAIESQFGREAVYQAQDLNQQRTSLLESGRGNAQGAYGLQLVDQQIEKSMRDLEQRKQEMILQGNAAAASKISDLQVQQLQFRADAQQKRFSNLMGIGNFGLQYQTMINQSEQAARQSSLEQLKYELDVQSQEDYRNKTTAELADMSIRTNIMKREMILKEAASRKEANLENLPGDAGWKDAAAQLTFGGQIKAQLEKIRAQGLTEDEMKAAMALLVDDYDNSIPDGIATRDAIGYTVFGEAWNAKPETDIQEPQNSNEYRGIFGLPSAVGGALGGMSDSLGYAIYGKYWNETKPYTPIGQVKSIFK